MKAVQHQYKLNLSASEKKFARDKNEDKIKKYNGNSIYEKINYITENLI
jgi:hypothetical protein